MSSVSPADTKEVVSSECNESWWYPTFPSREACAANIPLYDYTSYHFEVVKTSFLQCGWESPSHDYFWYIHSYHPERQTFYGFVKLNKWQDAEWGNIPYLLMYDNFRQCHDIRPMTDVFGNGPVMIKDIPKHGEIIGKYKNENIADIFCSHPNCTLRKEDCREHCECDD